MKSMLLALSSYVFLLIVLSVFVEGVQVPSPNFRAPDGNDYLIGHNFSGVKITEEIPDGYKSLTFKVENKTSQGWIEISIPKYMPVQDGQPVPAILKFNGKTVKTDYDKYPCHYGKSFVITEPSVIEVDFLYDEKRLDNYHYMTLNKECDSFQKTKPDAPLPPLKQFHSGIPFEEIQCRDSLVLIQKYDSSPACVNQETKPKLIKRGWMKTQVDVFDDAKFIESAKNLGSAQLFLSMHPDARINVDHENFVVTFEESGFREHPSGVIIHHTKQLLVNLDYDGRPTVYSLICGGPVSLDNNDMELLENPDWCFPIDQSEFDSFDREDLN